jgi:hypothetical protein
VVKEVTTLGGRTGLFRSGLAGSPAGFLHCRLVNFNLTLPMRQLAKGYSSCLKDSLADMTGSHQYW